MRLPSKALLSTMPRDIIPPCVGKHDLFDSIDPGDHQAAADICHTCPMKTECRTLMEKVRQGAPADGGPSGTWAGKLVGNAKVRADRIEAEDARFTERESLDANNAYNRGARDEWARTGHRVYERRRQIERRARKSAA